MTVKELIEKLQQYAPETRVVGYHDDYARHELNHVETECVDLGWPERNNKPRWLRQIYPVVDRTSEFHDFVVRIF